MFARKIHVEVLEPGEARECPVGWLDSFCMRSFTGRSALDDVLPISDGLLEAGFRVDLQFLQTDLEDWLTRKFGGGSRVKIRLTERDREAGPGNASCDADLKSNRRAFRPGKRAQPRISPGNCSPNEEGGSGKPI